MIVLIVFTCLFVRLTKETQFMSCWRKWSNPLSLNYLSLSRINALFMSIYI